MTAVPVALAAHADLFANERAALAQAREAYADAACCGADQRHALGQLIVHYERLMRESARLIARSDRAERDMNLLNRRLQDMAAQLAYRASHDPLTGALNRGAVIEQASASLLRADTALIVLDIDLFKRINDEYGHPTGDAVIQDVVQCLRQSLDAEAAIGRVGGEEFSVVRPAASAAEAHALGQRICDAIAGHVFAAPVARQITASVGVCWCRIGSSFDSAYARADEALYAAKRAGRNRVRLA